VEAKLHPCAFLNFYLTLTVKPRRESYRQASQEAVKNLALALLTSQPVNERCLSQINFLAII
ncbi:hypothetical protein, partial [uncultured Subdoligranulum sp.]|uniref:hypothetical protein n=1 Tax=uncultured Subdoligranulum sp. TaxID=512298 RepID=UPI0026188EC0